MRSRQQASKQFLYHAPVKLVLGVAIVGACSAQGQPEDFVSQVTEILRIQLLAIAGVA